MAEFDLKEYLNSNNKGQVLNESLQSSILGKIVYNGADTFKYVTFYRPDDNEGISRSNVQNEFKDGLMTRMNDADYYSSDIFYSQKREGLILYIIELCKLYIVYYAYQSGVLDENAFKKVYKRYLAIYDKWKKSINKGINSENFDVFRFFQYIYKNPISDITDSNFKRMTYKELKRNKMRNQIKENCVLFYMTSSERNILLKSDRPSTGKQTPIELPKDSLIAITVPNILKGKAGFMFFIGDIRYGNKYRANRLINKYGFTDTTELTMKDGSKLDLPYICGLSNVFDNVAPPEKTTEDSTFDEENLIPFNRSGWYHYTARSNGAEIKRTRLINLSNIVDIAERNSDMGPLGSFIFDSAKKDLEKLRIYNFYFSDFKFDLYNRDKTSTSSDKINDKIGNLFAPESPQEKFDGLWGIDDNDYVYIFLPNVPNEKMSTAESFEKWLEHANDDPKTGDITNKYNTNNLFSLQGYRANMFSGNMENYPLKKRARSLMKDTDFMTGKRQMVDTEEKITNISKYKSKLSALKNLNTKSKSLINTYNDFYRKVLDMQEKYDEVLDIGKNMVASKTEMHIFSKYTKQKTALLGIYNSYLNELQSLSERLLGFIQSNKNYLAEKYKNAWLDLDDGFRKDYMYGYVRHKSMKYPNVWIYNSQKTPNDAYKEINFEGLYEYVEKDINARVVDIEKIYNDFCERYNSIANPEVN